MKKLRQQQQSLRRSPQCLLSFQGNFKIKDILLGLTDDHYGQKSIKIVSKDYSVSLLVLDGNQPFEIF